MGYGYPWEQDPTQPTGPGASPPFQADTAPGPTPDLAPSWQAPPQNPQDQQAAAQGVQQAGQGLQQQAFGAASATNPENPRNHAYAGGQGSAYDLAMRPAQGMEQATNAEQSLNEQRQRDMAVMQANEAKRAAIRKQSEQDLAKAQEISPQHYWASKSGWQKALSVIGAAMGGWLGVQDRSGRNTFLEGLNDAIKEDVEAQKATFANKSSVHAQLVARLGSEDAAEAYQYKQAWDDAAEQVKIAAQRYDAETQKMMVPQMLQSIGVMQDKAAQTALEAQDKHIESTANASDKGVRPSQPSDFVQGKDGSWSVKKGLQIVGHDGTGKPLVYDPQLRATPKAAGSGPAPRKFNSLGGAQ